jgi:hypothetical protein
MEPNTPQAQPQQPAPQKSSKSTIVIVLVVVGVCGLLFLMILAALLIPAIVRATHNAKITACCNNLAMLWKAQANYMVRHGGVAKAMPVETGTDFWVKLTETDPPIFDETMTDVFYCPLGGLGKYGSTNYRGPAGNVNTFGDGDFVGADFLTNHSSDGSEGGNVLRKSGDVQLAGDARNPLWRMSFDVLEGGPKPKGAR